MLLQVGLTLHPTPSSSTTTITGIDLKTHLHNLDNYLLLQSDHSSSSHHHPPPQLQLQLQLHNNNNNNNQSINNNKGRVRGPLLQGLNLATIWPHLKAAADRHQEMSPRHLDKLQRLLSKSSIQYSPRNILGTRWREYHGSNDWSGLLDPLDENLRREVVRYGEFIQAAYRCFHSDPAMSPNKPPSPRHVTLSDTSYKVTKSLYATSSIGLPKWVDVVAPDLGWMTQRSSWIGYVAVCDDRNEIQRMGRRDIVIALRGTATCLEWGENFRDMLVSLNSSDDNHQNNPKVECGFSSLYNTQGAHVASLSQSVVDEVQRLIEQYKGETLSITVTGHSLGAALALLVAEEVSTCAPDAPPVAVFSFGGPRVGNRGFADHLKSNNVKVLRVVNNQDVITRVPGVFVSEELDKKVRSWGGGEKVLKVLDNKMPWAYTHVGTELRVDTKKSPYLKPNADVACCHDLEAYLHLVDGFLASNCPFRSNAKRSLWRLLNEQKSNMKKLYTTTTKTKTTRLSLNLDHNHHQHNQQNNYISIMSNANHVLPSPS